MIEYRPIRTENAANAPRPITPEDAKFNWGCELLGRLIYEHTKVLAPRDRALAVETWERLVKPRIAVYVSGGNVTDIAASDPRTEVIMFDYDNIEGGDPEPTDDVTDLFTIY